ncbi:MAG: hypothetical protein LBJ15_19595 [Comamonas sp.]|uniref:hypothetical protein n=1 Tax=Comamonas sp. TaxID=34028 RepID=UPI00282CF8BF|nr:hypothetical protein [Comamonas sp.]MDR0216180.1 hypothetical protein [Comamonas sp.]
MKKPAVIAQGGLEKEKPALWLALVYLTAFGFVRLGLGSFATLNTGGIMGDQMPFLSQM